MRNLDVAKTHLGHQARWLLGRLPLMGLVALTWPAALSSYLILPEAAFARPKN